MLARDIKLRWQNTRYKNPWLLVQLDNICCMKSCEFDENEQQNQNLLYKVDPHSTFHYNFLQPTTNVFIAQQVDHTRWKKQNVNPKLATKQHCTTSWEYLYLVFRSLKHSLEFGMAPTAMRKSSKIWLTGKDTIEGSHREEKETHKLILSWLSWLAVLLVGAYAQRQWWRQSQARWWPHFK